MRMEERSTQLSEHMKEGGLQSWSRSDGRTRKAALLEGAQRVSSGTGRPAGSGRIWCGWRPIWWHRSAKSDGPGPVPIQAVRSSAPGHPGQARSHIVTDTRKQTTQEEIEPRLQQKQRAKLRARQETR